jgi:polyisoprenoid-binding protein YceI
MSTAASPTIQYNIDPQHTGVHFKVRHLMISSVRGEFTKVSGSITVNPDDPESATVEASIDAASIQTREPDRDKHLRSADFLDVEKYPTLTFKSKRVKAKGPDAYDVVGDLTIHGVTKEVTLKVEDVSPETKDPWGLMRRGASISTTVNRKDFGMQFNMALETGGFVVGDDVQITIDAEFVRSA